MSADKPARPLLRVVRGAPSAEELAALIAVVTARSPGGGTRPDLPRNSWNSPARLVRTPVSPGPGGWRASARPG